METIDLVTSYKLLLAVLLASGIFIVLENMRNRRK
jgi:hypothetical protein